uniref:Uncharacterized protein LOC114329029 n=1 Tax=Diabrotica virgifera virgifera TaxID=50390 RepID=A0A6P7FG05_DIAVI
MKTTLVLAVLACVALTAYGKNVQVNDFLCDTCVTFASTVKKFVDEELPIEDVEKAAKELCDLLPGDLKDFCEKDLLPEVENIYNDVSKITPQEACQDLGFCDA